MMKQTALEHFGSQSALARAFGITQPCVHRWGDLLPLARAIELEDITGGELKVDWVAYGLRPRVPADIVTSEAA